WRSKIVRLRSSTAPQSAGEVALGAKRRVTEGAQGRASDAADNAIASGEETGLGKVEHAAQQALRVALAGSAVGEGVQAVELGEAVVVDHAEAEVQAPVDVLGGQLRARAHQRVGEAAQVRDVGAQHLAHRLGALAAGADDE